MVKFSCLKEGKPLIGIGLTKENLQKLAQGLPIFITNEDVLNMTGNEVNAHILIMYGDTTNDITAQLAPLITDQTKIHL